MIEMTAQGRPFGAWRRWGLRGAALATAFLLAACAATEPPETRRYHPAEAERVLAKAYETVFDKYIEPLDAAGFALRGVGGLSSIEPAFAAAREGGAIRVALGGSEFERFRVPAGGDVEAWARLTTHAIEAARRRSAALAAASSEDLYKAVLNGALEPLDRHSRYAGLRSARDYRAQREGFGGIGINLNFDGGRAQIITVLPESPAEGSALRAGDVILRVDGEPIADIEQSEVVWRLRGEIGSEVDLTISRKGVAAPFTVTLQRALIVAPTVHVRHDHGLAVIAISGFNQRTASHLNRVLRDLGQAEPQPQGIVLDLRGNPGGLLDQAVAVADSFLDHGRIVSTRGRHPDSFQVFNATGRDLAEHLPLVVLINGQSASAAEIVAAALQDQGRAVVVGSNSYGKGSVQNITRLPNDGELILTWARFHAPSGYALEHLGVVPNFCTSAGRDLAGPESLAYRAMESAIVLAAWRTHSGYDEASGRGLRERCPARSEKPEVDLDVAGRVLADRTLYARALGASAPALAKSKEDGAPAH